MRFNVTNDSVMLHQTVYGQNECTVEPEFKYVVEDAIATIFETKRIVKMHKLNKS